MLNKYGGDMLFKDKQKNLYIEKEVNKQEDVLENKYSMENIIQ